MRVTDASFAMIARRGLEQSLGRVQDYQARLASGRRIDRVSDAPGDAVRALRLRAEEADLAAYDRSASDALAWLGTADTALQSTSQVLRRVRDLALAGGNGALDPAAREALATEVDALRDELLALANTTYLGRPVFGGFGTAAVGQVAGAWAYAGDAGQVLRQVSADATVRVDVDGRAAFGFAPGDTNMLALLDTIAADLRAGATTALGADVAALDARLDAVGGALGEVGVRTARVEATRERGLARTADARDVRTTLEDADLADTVLRLSQAQAGYEAALATAARANLPSLAQFLR